MEMGGIALKLWASPLFNSATTKETVGFLAPALGYLDLSKY